MKKLLFFFTFLLLYSSSIIAQISYEYLHDAAGNRTSRTVINLPATISSPVSEVESNKLKEGEKINQHTDIFEDISISIFPNPTSGSVVIQITPINTEVENLITIFNMNGKVVQTHTGLTDINTLDFTRFKPGSYLLRLGMGDKHKTYKIIKN